MVTSCLSPADIQTMWWPTGGGLGGVLTDHVPPWSSEGRRLYCRHKDSRVRILVFGEEAHPSFVPDRPVFDRLQYAKLEGEDLDGPFYHMDNVLFGEGSPITLHCELGVVHFSLVYLLFLFLLIFSNLFFFENIFSLHVRMHKYSRRPKLTDLSNVLHKIKS